MKPEQAEGIFEHFNVGAEEPWIRYFARKPNSDKVFGGIVYTPRALSDITTLMDIAGWNSYIQLNPAGRSHKTRVSSDDVKLWSWFLLDIDPLYDSVGIEGAYAAWEVAHSKLVGLTGLAKLAPYVLATGRGVQAWYRFDPVSLDLIAPNTGIRYRDVASTVMSWWLDTIRNRMGAGGEAYGCTLDVSSSDLPRAMRMPHTINQKTGAASYFISMPPPCFTNANLLWALMHYAPKELWEPKPEPALLGLSEDATWHQYVVFMTRGGRIYVTEGAEEGGRHKAAVSALRSLKELGCPKKEVLRALFFGNSLSVPEPLDEEEIIKMVNQHYKLERFRGEEA